MVGLRPTAGGTAWGELGGPVKGLRTMLISTIAVAALAGSGVGAAGQHRAGSEPATVLGSLEDFEGSNPVNGSIGADVPARRLTFQADWR
jgi:hypothetical protein